jgi:hypothetical protein
VRDERWFSGEEINTLLASPLSCANGGDDDEDEEDEEEEKKKGDEEEEEGEPLWSAHAVRAGGGTLEGNFLRRAKRCVIIRWPEFQTGSQKRVNG